MANRAYLGSVYRRAVEQAKAGKKALAYTNFARLQPHYPGNSTLLLWLAFVSSDRAESRRMIESVAEQQPDHPAFATARAWLEEQERDPITRPSESATGNYLAALSALSFASVTAPPPKLESSGLPPELHLMVNASLGEGEKIFWTAQPDPVLLFKQNTHGFWRRTGLITLLLFIPFWLIFGWTLVGLALAVAFVGYSLIRREAVYRASFQTAYALTNRRIMILTAHPYKLKSYYPHQDLRITKIRLVERPDGSGDLFFSKSAQSTETGLMGIAQASQVRELIERVLRKSPTPKATLEPRYEWPTLDAPTENAALPKETPDDLPTTPNS